MPDCGQRLFEVRQRRCVDSSLCRSAFPPRGPNRRVGEASVKGFHALADEPRDKLSPTREPSSESVGGVRTANIQTRRIFQPIDFCGERFTFGGVASLQCRAPGRRPDSIHAKFSAQSLTHIFFLLSKGLRSCEEQMGLPSNGLQ